VAQSDEGLPSPAGRFLGEQTRGQQKSFASGRRLLGRWKTRRGPRCGILAADLFGLIIAGSTSKAFSDGRRRKRQTAELIGVLALDASAGRAMGGA
jgi:hypothetical protein